ncbi:hypothetical protein Q9L58_007709 [Maublancomyces gigas]|uniref:Uncharacterized protein n=1 Tax=Discina gigas TaxID=1032678 RepID=A0ABR3GBQ1_9PEZI
MASPSPSPSSPTPYRQIRALYTATTITVYQAYSPAIALAAVTQQKLSAAPEFTLSRMTWIKPSWYRSGYSFKDDKQTHILALTMSRDRFEHLLSLSSSSDGTGVARDKCAVRVQWDPERNVELARMPWRSVQIGIGRAVVAEWVEEWILKIEDVTECAREMKRLLDEGRVEEARGLMPEERVYPLEEGLRKVLRMEEAE